MKFKRLFIFMLFCSFFIKAQNNFVDSVIPYAFKLYEDKQYELSSRQYERVIASGILDGELFYNNACSYALAGNKDEAFRNLDSCVKYNWRDFGLTETDSDLESLHGDPRWPFFINKFRDKLNNNKAEKAKETPTYFWGMYLGILLVFFMYNLMMFFSIRDVTYLYYSLSIFFLIQLHSLIISDFGFFSKEIFVWLKYFPVRKSVSYPIASMVIIFHLLFIKGFINLKERHPKLNKYNTILIWALVISVPCLVVPDSPLIYFPLFIIAYAYSLYVSIYSWRKGFKPSRFLVIGSIFLTIGVSIVLLNGLNIVDLRFNISVFRSDNLGFISFYAFLSFALGDKINVLTREKAEVQEKALEVLEAKVVERTAELAHEKHLVEEKQKDILDSIRYAKRIQTSLMPNEKYLSGIFNRRKK